MSMLFYNCVVDLYHMTLTVGYPFHESRKPDCVFFCKFQGTQHFIYLLTSAFGPQPDSECQRCLRLYGPDPEGTEKAEGGWNQGFSVMGGANVLGKNYTD